MKQMFKYVKTHTFSTAAFVLSNETSPFSVQRSVQLLRRLYFKE
ncbi:unnamed protein product, partial [Rotaria sp. Silwood1]